MCAVGCLIPDEDYSQIFEGHSIYGGKVREYLKAYSMPMELLGRLQNVHDKNFPDRWHTELAIVAAQEGLSDAVLKEKS